MLETRNQLIRRLVLDERASLIEAAMFLGVSVATVSRAVKAKRLRGAATHAYLRAWRATRKIGQSELNRLAAGVRA